MAHAPLTDAERASLWESLKDGPAPIDDMREIERSLAAPAGSVLEYVAGETDDQQRQRLAARGAMEMAALVEILLRIPSNSEETQEHLCNQLGSYRAKSIAAGFPPEPALMADSIAERARRCIDSIFDDVRDWRDGRQRDPMATRMVADMYRYLGYSNTQFVGAARRAWRQMNAEARLAAAAPPELADG